MRRGNCVARGLGDVEAANLIREGVMLMRAPTSGGGRQVRRLRAPRPVLRMTLSGPLGRLDISESIAASRDC